MYGPAARRENVAYHCARDSIHRSLNLFLHFHDQRSNAPSSIDGRCCRNGNSSEACPPSLRGIAMNRRREVAVGRRVQETLLFALGVSPSTAADIHKDCQAL